MAKTEKAIFAGGCFWCMESAFYESKGLVSVTSGYMGGSKQAANYKDVSKGNSGHFEVVEIVYDPAIVGYQELLETFWFNIDPTDEGGQFADRGSQYYTAVFYTNSEQQQLAEESKRKAEEKLGKKIVTKILPATEFYSAEDYHQQYHVKNPLHYRIYAEGSGRKHGVKKLWKK